MTTETTVSHTPDLLEDLQACVEVLVDLAYQFRGGLTPAQQDKIEDVVANALETIKEATV